MTHSMTQARKWRTATTAVLCILIAASIAACNDAAPSEQSTTRVATQAPTEQTGQTATEEPEVPKTTRDMPDVTPGTAGRDPEAQTPEPTPTIPQEPTKENGRTAPTERTTTATTPPEPTEPSPTKEPEPTKEHPLIEKARNAAANHLGLGEDEAKSLRLEGWESVTWSDGSMGCPDEGYAYTGAEVEGFIMRFTHQAGSATVHLGEQSGYAFVTTDCTPTHLPQGRPRPEGNLDPQQPEVEPQG